MCKLLYPSIRVRTAHPVSVRVRVRVSVSFNLRCNTIAHMPTVLRVSADFVIADLNPVAYRQDSENHQFDD